MAEPTIICPKCKNEIKLTESLAAPLIESTLRYALAETALARQASEGQQTKMELVYQYLTGPRFRQRVQAIAEAFGSMKEDLDKEKKAITKQWARAGGFDMTASREDAKTRSNQWNLEEVSSVIVDCAYKLHVALGPGLLETVYEVVLAKMLEERGLTVRRQVQIPIVFMGMSFDEGFRADLIVQELVLVELKSVESFAPVHGKQVLTYLRLLKMPLGLLINFGAATFKEGVKRIVNHHQDFASSRLRVNQAGANLTQRREDANTDRVGGGP